MTDRLEMNFLGTPEVFYGGQRVKFATNKALALLAYLVVETGVHPRQKLQAIFWPESKTHLAQSALRNTLVRLKNGLQGVDGPFRIEGDQLGFNLSCDYNLDLDLVRRAAADSKPSQISATRLTLLKEATEAGRGPFLEAFSLPDAPSFDDWIMDQRTIFGQRLNLIFDHLSTHQLETHDILPAIETANRWLVLDRLNETAYRRLMRLHFLNGDRSSALQTYETCCRLLSQELGIDPSPETEEVMAFIRSVSLPAPAPVTPAKSHPILQIPFIGRSNEFKTLVSLFHQARGGIPQVAVVSGEAGIGKSRLADEFLNWAGTENTDILCGSAYQTMNQLPHQPIIDTLRERLERENAPEDLLDDVWLTELTLILPELRERYPDLPVAACDETLARSRLFEAIARLGQSLSARVPLILFLDNFQWADTSTFELTHYLVRSWYASHSPILVLILVRCEALSQGSGLRDWIVSLGREFPVTRFDLTPFADPDVLQLVRSLAGDNKAGLADLATWLYAETGGQPLFVVENLAALEKLGALDWKDGDLDPAATLVHLKSIDASSLTSTIQGVIPARLEGLSQPAAAMLAAAAVIGRNCSFSGLCQVSGIDEQNGLNALDELLSVRLISETRDQDRPYTTSHDLIREVVYGGLSAARQQVFHQRALFALAEAGGSPAELAYHALHAHQWELAFNYSLAAGEEARMISAEALARQHFQNALRLLREGKVTGTMETVQQLSTRLGQNIEV